MMNHRAFGDMSKCYFINIPLSMKCFKEYIFICSGTCKSLREEEQVRGCIFPLFKYSSVNCMPLDPHTSAKGCELISWHVMLLILYSKHTNKNSGFYHAFQNHRKAYKSDKNKKKNVHYVQNTFLYKTMAVFFLPKCHWDSPNSMRIVIKTFTIYKYTHNSETINKLTINFFLHIWHIQ